jgi:hypothetical protein
VRSLRRAGMTTLSAMLVLIGVSLAAPAASASGYGFQPYYSCTNKWNAPCYGVNVTWGGFNIASASVINNGFEYAVHVNDYKCDNAAPT